MVTRKLFFESMSLYCAEPTVQLAHWSAIEAGYSEKGRHYHTINHLDNLSRELLPFRNKVKDWNTVVFAIAYHDIVYNSVKNNNEEKSAEVAVSKLSSISFPVKGITRCRAMILATKHHELSDDRDINLFMDADLSILGADMSDYLVYAGQVRREYSIYPDFLYNPGRVKVLKHFLGMPHIFKTPEFQQLYEAQARINLQEELRVLEN